MFVFRVFALCALGLIVSVVLVDLFKGPPGAHFASEAGMLVFLSLFILVLGPLWPSAENIEKWHRKTKFNLPTDNPDVGLYVFCFATSLFSLSMAWHRYSDPVTNLWRMEKLASTLSGHAGIVAMWLIIAIGCLIGGIGTFRKTIRAKKTDLPA
jgi:hypothetical protein